MTCILSYADGKTVWMGGDSSVQNGSWEQQTLLERKVFKRGNVMFGVCGKLRPAQVIRASLVPPEHDTEIMNDQDYLVMKLIPSMSKLLGNHNANLKDDEGVTGLVIGYRGRIYQMDSWYTIYSPRDQICQDGSGGVSARGAFAALMSRRKDEESIEDLMIQSMQIAGRFDLSVAEPYYVEKLEIAE